MIALSDTIKGIAVLGYSGAGVWHHYPHEVVEQFGRAEMRAVVHGLAVSIDKFRGEPVNLRELYACVSES